MAVKKTTTKSAGAPKAAPKKAAASKQAAAPKKAAAATQSTPKAASPKAAPKTAAAPKKKAAPVKLTDRQTELLKRVHDTEGGYVGTKGESKSLDSLQSKKLIKRGAKDKESGNFRYLVSKAGAKHHNTPPASQTP